MKSGVYYFSFFRIFVLSFIVVLVMFVLFYGGSYIRGYVLIRAALEAIEYDPLLKYSETRKKVRRAFVVIDDRGAPRKADEKFIMAVQYYREGDVERAITLLFDIAKSERGYCNAYAYLGYILCYEGEEDSNMIKSLLEKAIECNPQKPLYYTWLGSYYKNRITPENEKEYREKAKECYKKALSLNEEDLSAWNNYGNLLVDMKEYDEAERVYKRAIEIFPGNGTPQYNLATLMALKGDKESALRWLKEALKYNPELRRAAMEDKDFSNLREDARFQELIYNRVKEKITTIVSDG